MTLQWSGLQEVKLEGTRKRIPCKVVIADPIRFLLFQADPKRTPTLWCLRDYQTEETHALYGVDWAQAQQAATRRILAGTP